MHSDRELMDGWKGYQRQMRMSKIFTQPHAGSFLTASSRRPGEEMGVAKLSEAH